ncbi:hypothetical protein R3P38DRAFT_3226685 [Favolaschia claudopus]|uniref:Uncharacterized protein n=1 Tax=Favolaschia claudopus TaxID=2862362 RepID=A0AAV9ZT09_9AGAR
MKQALPHRQDFVKCFPSANSQGPLSIRPKLQRAERVLLVCSGVLWLFFHHSSALIRAAAPTSTPPPSSPPLLAFSAYTSPIAVAGPSAVLAPTSASRTTPCFLPTDAPAFAASPPHDPIPPPTPNSVSSPSPLPAVPADTPATAFPPPRNRAHRRTRRRTRAQRSVSVHTAASVFAFGQRAVYAPTAPPAFTPVTPPLYPIVPASRRRIRVCARRYIPAPTPIFAFARAATHPRPLYARTQPAIRAARRFHSFSAIGA